SPISGRGVTSANELPAAPASVESPAVVFAGADAEALARLLGAPPSDLAEVVRSLDAHAIAAAESFENLLALATMRGIELHRYQLDTARRVLRVLRGRALLADEVGLGKTVEALLTLREYQVRGMVRRALVLVPAPLVRQWTGELASKAQLVPRTTDDPSLRESPELFWHGDGVVVASHALARSSRHAPLVQAVPWDMVIVDEAHHVKNRTTLSWKLVDALKSRFLLLLTATPIENDLEELYNLITLLKPGQFATPAVFRRQFVDTKNPTAPRNRERLRALLAEVMVRNTRAQSGLRLPPRFVTTATVEPLPEERALYEETLAFFRAHADDAGARLAASTLLLEAGSSPDALAGTLDRMISDHARSADSFRGALGPLAAAARRVKKTRKAERLVDLVRAHGGRALVFTRYRATLAHVCTALGEAGLAHVGFHGAMSGQEKHEAVERFRETPCAMVATDVGAEGQNLQFCNVLVNFDLPWNPMLIEQRIGRLHRMGQTEEVTVYNLCAQGTIEERVLDVLDRRLHLFELVVGEMDMVLGNVADERDLEERVLALYAAASTDEDISRGFDAIAEDIALARGRYDRTRAFDDALFGEDYEA
ncbi:MAG: DEAD/DEAH box helicase, partial [Vulcanimicrobiaceae bacterium]